MDKFQGVIWVMRIEKKGCRAESGGEIGGKCARKGVCWFVYGKKGV